MTRDYYIKNREEYISRVRAYKQTLGGLITDIYAKQRSRSKLRGHESPNYSKEWLREFITSSENFEDLFNSWVDGGFQRMDYPSIDRIDDSIGYTKDNIRLVSWRENHRVESNAKSKVIIQSNLDGSIVCEHRSMMDAAKNTGASQPKISMVCNGLRNKHYGYRWSFKK